MGINSDISTKLNFTPVEGANYSFDYSKIIFDVNRLVDSEPRRFLHLMRTFCQDDLFFLLYFILKVPVNHPWLVDRITEVQNCNDRTLDLWAREHFKSSIITYGLNIQEILQDPETRIGIFSHTKSIAKSFLFRIKTTFESNEVLKALFPDIFYSNPEYDSPRWSLDDGICVRRHSVFQEMTVEAWGLVDGMPTSKHFPILNYDDIVTKESVSTPEQIKKVDDSLRLSFNLGTQDGKKRIIGTIYHFNDSHIKLMNKLDSNGNNAWKVRRHPCIDSLGKPVILTEEQLEEKKLDQGPYVFSCQMLLNPVADALQEFKPEWVKYWRTLPEPLNKYGVCDPASSKKRGSDYTVIGVIGLDVLGNYYLIDMIRKRLNLRERWLALKEMQQIHPDIKKFGYEKYAMQSDQEYFEEMMRREGFNFTIEALGGIVNKKERIRRLQPRFAAGRYYLPYSLQVDGEDLTKIFLEEEYLLFPYCPHDDMLDMNSRIFDDGFEASRPVSYPIEEKRERYDRYKKRSGSWMAA